MDWNAIKIIGAISWWRVGMMLPGTRIVDSSF